MVQDSAPVSLSSTEEQPGLIEQAKQRLMDDHNQKQANWQASEFLPQNDDVDENAWKQLRPKLNCRNKNGNRDLRKLPFNIPTDNKPGPWNQHTRCADEERKALC